eukprot:TRINITY_DN66934_c2_g2_i2.p1 TRINITY_DN66934_c2_g2~~TRINITY_DN66934_c2_g2_i2.p1  ORF type:complete len:101 (+),score=0.44 TRINITY_DN66934_c2_g2_i2:311-613(+)
MSKLRVKKGRNPKKGKIIQFAFLIVLLWFRSDLLIAMALFFLQKRRGRYSGIKIMEKSTLPERGSQLQMPTIMAFLLSVYFRQQRKDGHSLCGQLAECIS